MRGLFVERALALGGSGGPSCASASSARRAYKGRIWLGWGAMGLRDLLRAPPRVRINEEQAAASERASAMRRMSVMAARQLVEADAHDVLRRRRPSEVSAATTQKRLFRPSFAYLLMPHALGRCSTRGRWCTSGTCRILSATSSGSTGRLCLRSIYDPPPWFTLWMPLAPL